MDTKFTDKPNRYTSQKKQELINRHQLCERLVEFGWMPNAPEDLGEDFIVHIYFQGQATGVTFHIQEKSITNLNERRKGNYLIYDDFKVKDLKHWEGFSLPLVLVVWDIELREGKWALVDDVIKDLDQRRPQWRNNKSKVRVYITYELVPLFEVLDRNRSPNVGLTVGGTVRLSSISTTVAPSARRVRVV